MCARVSTRKKKKRLTTFLLDKCAGQNHPASTQCKRLSGSIARAHAATSATGADVGKARGRRCDGRTRFPLPLRLRRLRGARHNTSSASQRLARSAHCRASARTVLSAVSRRDRVSAIAAATVSAMVPWSSISPAFRNAAYVVHALLPRPHPAHTTGSPKRFAKRCRRWSVVRAGS
jgi:hypothetical protein